MMLIDPAPFGVDGLEFGNTTEYPYRPGYPHQGQDHQWRLFDPIRSKQVVAGASGTVITAYNDGGYHLGWGNYVDILIPSATHRIVLRLAHHQTGTVVAPRGQQITAGAPVGVMGATGKVVGVHLHEGLLINGVWVDPIYYRTHHLPGTSTEAPAGGGSKPFNPTEDEDDMFTDEDRALLRQARDASASAKAGIWDGGRNTIDGVVQTFNYGALPIVAHSQAFSAAQIASLTELVRQIAGGNATIDMAAVQAAAAAGAREALDGLTLTAVTSEAVNDEQDRRERERLAG